MAIDASALDPLSRDELIAKAKKLGVQRAEVMTRVELKDEIVRRTATDDLSRRRARGWLGVARDLVASLIEEGLNMPDAAKLVRSGVSPTVIRHQPPVATVTLAEIYATQGHVKRALAMLDEVLAKEPDHAAARALRERLGGEPPEAEATTASEPVEREQEQERALDHEHQTRAPPATLLVEEVTRRPIVAPPPARARTGIVTIVVESGDIYVYWEIDPKTLEHAEKRWPGGRAAVQLVALVPSWDGARRYEHEIPIEPRRGSTTAPPFGECAVVRAALGWCSKEGFRPLAIATELDPPETPGADPAVRWAPSARSTAEPDVRVRAAREFAERR